MADCDAQHVSDLEQERGELRDLIRMQEMDLMDRATQEAVLLDRLADLERKLHDTAERADTSGRREVRKPAKGPCVSRAPEYSLAVCRPS